MTGRALDYDRTSIPDGYDRARDHGPQYLDLWMRTVAAVMPRERIRSILDLGCGTGRFSYSLAESFGATVIAIDPSSRMLAKACAKRGTRSVHPIAARGENVPLPAASIDLVFISMVFHHFSAPAQAAGECRRVLRGHGRVFLRGGSSDRIASYPYVPFFPESLPLLAEMLPSCARTREPFERAGFRTIMQELLVQQIAATHAEYADKLEAGGDSVLARLSASDFAAGVDRLRAHARRVDPEPVTEPIDYFVFG